MSNSIGELVLGLCTGLLLWPLYAGSRDHGTAADRQQ